MLKVLLVSPYRGTIGGISRWTGHILRYYNEHNDSNIRIVQYYKSSSNNSNSNKSFFSRIFNGFVQYVPMIFELKSIFKKDSFDAVHLCSSASISLIKDIAILKLAKKFNVRSVIHFRFGRIPQIFSDCNWECKLLRKAINLATRVIVIDQKSYNTLIQQGYHNIVLLPNPLTPSVLSIMSESRSLSHNNRQILFAGHVIETKGPHELVMACKKIANIKLRMIGAVTDDMKKLLREEAGEDSESWFEIIGEVDYKTTIQEMLSAGIFVLPTYTEGFPNVILESMACGCPIVTTDVGAIPEMLDIEHGFNYGICVKPKDVEGLRVAIEKMLNDREYALQCGRNAQKRVQEEYSMPIVWNKLTSIWKSTVEN